MVVVILPPRIYSLFFPYTFSRQGFMRSLKGELIYVQRQHQAVEPHPAAMMVESREETINPQSSLIFTPMF
jgi:hypothetical protein